MSEAATSPANGLRTVVRLFSGAKVFYFGLFYLVAILTAGTLAQSTLGIYEANERYFSAWITWCFDRVPVPGGRLVLTVLSVNLLGKLLLNSRWRLKSMGINIAHLGTMLLMVGALLTAYFSIEGSMYIVEGGSARYYQDDANLALRITEIGDEPTSQVRAFSGPYLQPDAEIEHEKFPGQIKVRKVYRNMELVFSDEPKSEEWRGMARRFVVEERHPEKNPGDNRGALIVGVSGCDPGSNGRHIIAQVEGPAATIQADGRRFQLSLGRRVYQLPGDLRIELIDFIAEYYPGTNTPRHYASKLRIHDKGTQRLATIKMNEPLRLYEYTFFQSSFDKRGGGPEATILSVVENHGRMFPYIASIVICIGIGLHLLLHYPAYLARFVKDWT